MGLPTVSLPRETVTLPDGQTIEVRGLTRGQAMELRGLAEKGEPGAVERHVLARGTDTPIDEVGPWYEKTDSSVVSTIVKAIMRLSGLDEDSSKNGSEG